MRLSRRRFLGLAGTAALGAALGSYGPKGVQVSVETPFVSRPDLDPPLVRVTGPGGAGGGYVLVTPAGPLMVDHTGEPVWVHPVHEAATNLQVQRYQGAPVLSWWEGTVTHYGLGTGEGVLLDARYREIARLRGVGGLPADLHELILTDRGTAYITAAGVVDADLSSVGGPRHGRVVESAVQELDVATGALVFEWRASRHVGLEESYMHVGRSTSVPFDPYHLNSIQELADGSLLVSARNTWSLYRVDKASGAILWRLGGKRSDFRLGTGAQFAWQHDARLRADGTISLFDDESWPREHRQSRALILALDEARRTVSVKAAYVHTGEPISAGSQGSVQVLADDDLFVGWGARPFFSQFRRDGTMVLDGHILKGDSYRAFRSPWQGRPVEAPAVALRRRGPGSVSVFVSWNGSTETARWQVRPAGAGSRALAAAPRTGFETELGPIRPTGPVVVEALSASGRVLARSLPARAD